MDFLELTKKILSTNLHVAADELEPDTQIIGELPQFNSLSMTGIITAIEAEMDCEIEDDEIDAETFATVSSLAEFIESKA